MCRARSRGFRGALRDDRREPVRRRWLFHTIAVVGASCAFMIVTAWMAQPWWELVFLSDDSPVSWLSSALLMANAVLVLKLTLDDALPRVLGYSTNCVLLLLAVDEQFMLHERYKHSRLLQRSSSDAVLVSWLGNVPIILVALGGIAFCVVVLPRNLRSSHQELDVRRRLAWRVRGLGRCRRAPRLGGAVRRSL